jgi:hypothetical protein
MRATLLLFTLLFSALLLSGCYGEDSKTALQRAEPHFTDLGFRDCRVLRLSDWDSAHTWLCNQTVENEGTCQVSFEATSADKSFTIINYKRLKCDVPS